MVLNAFLKFQGLKQSFCAEDMQGNLMFRLGISDQSIFQIVVHIVEVLHTLYIIKLKNIV